MIVKVIRPDYHQVMECTGYTFFWGSGAFPSDVVARIDLLNGTTLIDTVPILSGNELYIMNDSGKTVDSYNIPKLGA